MKRTITTIVCAAAAAALAFVFAVSLPVVHLGHAAQVSQDTYKAITNTPSYGRSDGFYMDSSYNTYLMINGSEVMHIDADGDLDLSGSSQLEFENGEIIDNDTDDFLCFNGVGGTSDEDICFDLDGTNVVDVTTNTGVTNFDFNTIDVTTDKLSFDTTAEFIDSAAGTICLNGSGGSNNEDLCFDMETAANTIGLASNTGVVGVDFAATGTTITLANDQTIVSDTDTEIQFGDAGEDISLGFSTNTVTMTTDTGVTKFDFGSSIGVTAGVPALLLQSIRFCGNGPDGGTETFLSPVPFDDTEADFISGGAGCDGEDNTTIGNADEPWPIMATSAYKPVAAICTAVCTGATAANDAIVFKFYDDTAAVSEATCTTAALGGDGVAAQCTWTDTTPATVAAGSAIAIGVDNTDDDCNDAGDDFECLVFVTF